MEDEYGVFTGGVRPGSVTTTHDVMILICYVISRAGCPVSYEQLSRVLLGQELVNYFEFTRAMTGLEDAEQIESREGGWVLTDKGTSTAETFGDALPKAARDRAEGAMSRMLTLLRREKENRVSIEKKDDGYIITMTITDIGSDLMSLSLFLPGEAECEEVRKRFLNDPALLYKGVFALATGDTETVGRLIPSGDDLFSD